jgi:hypothetical protein
MATSSAATKRFDTFMARAWADHATRSDAVARRLRMRTPPPQTPGQVAQLVRIVVHLLGEHLGRFDDARWRLDALRAHALADDSVQSALRVAAATLDIGQDRAHAFDALDAAQTLRAEAAAASLCLGRGRLERALQLIASAAARLAALPDATAQDHRPLAVACNNMTWELHDLGARRSPEQTQAMLRLAAASREHWSRAGTWLEIERAEYGLAITHLSAGLHDDAWRHAAQCLAVCLHHKAPPYELLYAHEAMARVHHARRESAELAHHAQLLRAAFARLSRDDRSANRGMLDAVLALGREQALAA